MEFETGVCASCITLLCCYFFRHIVRGIVMSRIDDYKFLELNILTKDRAEKKLVIITKVNVLRVLIKGRFTFFLILVHMITVDAGILAAIIIYPSEFLDRKALRKVYSLCDGSHVDHVSSNMLVM